MVLWQQNKFAAPSTDLLAMLSDLVYDSKNSRGLAFRNGLTVEPVIATGRHRRRRRAL